MPRRVFLIAVLGLVGLVLAAEIGLRVFAGLGDPPLARPVPLVEYELVPSADHWRFGNRITINEHGMRAAPHGALPRPDERRVLLIGDSVVYGTHRLDQEETIAVRLEALLMARASACDTRVLPLAASSWGPVNMAAALRGSGLFGAQEVVIVVSAHDLFDLPSWQTSDIPYAIATPGLAVLDAAAALARRRYGWRILPWAPPAAAPPAEGTLPPDSVAAIAEMVATARKAGATVWLAYHPTVGEPGAPPPPGRAAFEGFAALEGVPFVAFGEHGLGQGDYVDIIHPSASGARRIAQILAKTLGAGESEACG
ncbi:MAG: hypothetical protein AAF968_10245 [Pseudomonadota bacterium]